jgi:IMP dehydrogenase
MKNMLKWIEERNLKDIYVVAGNVATPEGAYDLATEWGADCVKVGIGPGSACLTRKNTGVGVPQLFALETIHEEFARQGIKAKIIADGGMSVRGDIPKGMKYANAAMLGLMLAGTTETPGKVFTDENGELYKVYAGSASGESKVSNGDANEFVEGVAKTVRFRGHVEHILRYIKEGLQSAYSYVGAKTTPEFQEKCEFGEMTAGGKTESKI